jgi:hypothetical protein
MVWDILKGIRFAANNPADKKTMLKCLVFGIYVYGVCSDHFYRKLC